MGRPIVLPEVDAIINTMDTVTQAQEAAHHQQQQHNKTRKIAYARYSRTVLQGP
jgi:hypothetical protein